MDKQNDTVSILVLWQGRSSMEERHLEYDHTECSKKGGDRVLDGRSTAERSGQVADRVVQTSTRALGRRADRTGRLDREVGDSSIGAMDAEGGMEQNGDKNDAGTASQYPRNLLDSRLLDAGR